MKVYVVLFQCGDDVRIEKVFGDMNDATVYTYTKVYEECLTIEEMDVD